MAIFHFGPSRAVDWVGENIYPQCVKVFWLREQRGLSSQKKIFANARATTVQDDL